MISPLEGVTDPPRFLSQSICSALIDEIRALGHGRARTMLQLVSQWRGDVRWARNQPHVADDWRDTTLTLQRSLPKDSAFVISNQVDPASLSSAVQWAEQLLRFTASAPTPWPPEQRSVVSQYAATAIWSDATYAQTPDARSAIVEQLVAGAERSGMLSSGYVAVEARGTTLSLADDQVLYAPQTLAQCSLTVRDPQGAGSGWAGCSSYDWNRFDAAKLAEIALDKCLRSRNPVAIEPGRYTVILEPQATFALAAVLMRSALPNYMGRGDNEDLERGALPFKSPRIATYPFGWKGRTIQIRFTRLGERVLDPRLNIVYDPLDPDLGVIPFDPGGEPYTPVTWFDQGVLQTLSYDRAYAQQMLRREGGELNSRAFRMTSTTPPVSLEEMIRTTQRGLLVTRFWDVLLLDPASMLCTGITRDGLWLIEHGEISHPVKNLRFTESPMFAFNNVEQIGAAVPVFTPEVPAVVPAMRVRDFSFTALDDAI